MKKFITCLIFIIFYSLNIIAQISSYISVGEYESNKKTWIEKESKIIVSISDSTITTDTEKLEMVCKGEWCRMKKCECITFSCIDENLNKTFVRFYRYYNKRKITIYIIKQYGWKKYYIPCIIA